MSPSQTLAKGDRALNTVALMLILMPVLVFIGRKRIYQAAREIAPLEVERDHAREEATRLRAQLDGALEALHEAQESQGSAKGDPRPEPGKALDTPGSPGSGPGS